MAKSDRNYYTHAKYGVVFFTSIVLLAAIIIYIIVQSNYVKIIDYSYDFGKFTPGQTISGSDELRRAHEELKQGSVTLDDEFKRKYPSLYALLVFDEGVYNENKAYAESNGEYIGMAQSFKRILSRYVNLEVMIMNYSCTAVEGSVTVSVEEPTRYNLKYDKSNGRIDYSITTGTDARIRINTLAAEFEGEGFSKVNYNINASRKLSDTELEENKFQQFVTVYSGDMSYVLNQNPSDSGEKSVGAYADYGFRGNTVGVSFDLSGDLYDVFYGADISAYSEEAGELRYSLKIN